MAVIEVRAYSGRRDVPLLLNFGSRCFAERFPLPASWHPGDFIWEMQADYDRPHPIRMWLSPAGVEAIAWKFGPGEAWIEALPQSEHLVEQAVAWAEQSARDAGATRLSIRAFCGDQTRIGALEALGYRQSGPEGVWFRLDLAKPLRERAVPEGFRVRDSAGIDPEARAKAHRDAWNDLSHIGLPDARSKFTTEVYLRLRDAPVYDPSLDILVETADGELVSNCVCWADAPSGIGIFEPVGTHAAYRGRRLAGLAILEGLRRLRTCGMKWARIGTAHFNKPAIAAYTDCGFELYERTAWWARELPAEG